MFQSIVQGTFSYNLQFFFQVVILKMFFKKYRSMVEYEL